MQPLTLLALGTPLPKQKAQTLQIPREQDLAQSRFTKFTNGQERVEEEMGKRLGIFAVINYSETIGSRRMAGVPWEQRRIAIWPWAWLVPIYFRVAFAAGRLCASAVNCLLFPDSFSTSSTGLSSNTQKSQRHPRSTA